VGRLRCRRTALCDPALASLITDPPGPLLSSQPPAGVELKSAIDGGRRRHHSPAQHAQPSSERSRPSFTARPRTAAPTHAGRQSSLVANDGPTRTQRRGRPVPGTAPSTTPQCLTSFSLTSSEQRNRSPTPDANSISRPVRPAAGRWPSLGGSLADPSTKIRHLSEAMDLWPILPANLSPLAGR
jgi:hypothetical protein